MVQPERSRPLNRDCHSPSAECADSGSSRAATSAAGIFKDIVTPVSKGASLTRRDRSCLGQENDEASALVRARLAGGLAGRLAAMGTSHLANDGQAQPGAARLGRRGHAMEGLEDFFGF